MKKILLVDDSSTVRNTLKIYLCDEYEVCEAENGQIGLDKAKKEDFAAFLIDVNMPVMDGITLTANLRAESKYSKTPILILTTESRADKREAGKKAGANGWIVKPCDGAKLLSVLSKMV